MYSRRSSMIWSRMLENKEHDIRYNQGLRDQEHHGHDFFQSIAAQDGSNSKGYVQRSPGWQKSPCTARCSHVVNLSVFLAGQGRYFPRSIAVQVTIQLFRIMSAYLEVTVTDHSTLLSVLEYIGQNWDDVLFLSSVEMLCENFHSVVYDFHSDLSNVYEMWTRLWGWWGATLICVRTVCLCQVRASSEPICISCYPIWYSEIMDSKVAYHYHVD